MFTFAIIMTVLSIIILMVLFAEYLGTDHEKDKENLFFLGLIVIVFGFTLFGARIFGPLFYKPTSAFLEDVNKNGIQDIVYETPYTGGSFYMSLILFGQEDETFLGEKQHLKKVKSNLQEQSQEPAEETQPIVPGRNQDQEPYEK